MQIFALLVLGSEETRPCYTDRMSASNVLTRAIIDYLYTRRVFAWRAQSTGLFDAKTAQFRTAPKKGVADILAIQPPTGRFLAIEVKIGKDTLSPEQIGFLKNVEQCGGLSFVAHDLESFKIWFDSLSTEM